MKLFLYAIFFIVGGSEGSESRMRYIRILPQDMIHLYSLLVEQNMDPDVAATIVLQASLRNKRAEEKGT